MQVINKKLLSIQKNNCRDTCIPRKWELLEYEKIKNTCMRKTFTYPVCVSNLTICYYCKCKINNTELVNNSNKYVNFVLDFWRNSILIVCITSLLRANKKNDSKKKMAQLHISLQKDQFLFSLSYMTHHIQAVSLSSTIQNSPRIYTAFSWQCDFLKNCLCDYYFLIYQLKKFLKSMIVPKHDRLCSSFCLLE